MNSLISGLGIAVVIGFALVIRNRSFKRDLASFYDSQPCPGRTKQAFSWTRATLQSFWRTHDWVAEGYAKYGKAGILFIIPNARNEPVVVLPPSQVKNVLSKPESQLEAHGPGLEMIQAQYTLQDPGVYPSNYEVPIIKRITKSFPSVCQELAEEVALAFDEYWGTSADWHTAKVWRDMEYIAARALNRVIFGIPLCRDESFLQGSLTYSREIMSGIAINLIPNLIKPLIGPIMALRGSRNCEACMKMLIPLIKERIKLHEKHSPAPNDILQWMIQESSNVSGQEHMDPRRLARRIMVLNFNATPPVGMTLGHLLLNLHSLPRERSLYVTEKLRSECETVLRSTDEGYWTKDAVSKLHLVDSTIRESMRHSDFGAIGLPRRVSAPNGIEISGTRVPKGAHIEVPVHNIHMDGDAYLNPTKFEPFRFAPVDVFPDQTYDSMSRKQVVTLDDTFFGFGYGKNACPGRFFGAHLMKIILAYILQHYDVEHLPARPADLFIMEFRAITDKASIRVRRRA